MKDFFKYLTTGEEDKNWGIYLTVVGNARIKPQDPYPSSDHPTGYFYQWIDGRILKEFQVNYISEGRGVLELESGTFAIKPGSLMVIRPGVWHRYKPDRESGWHEHYIGFNGDSADHFLNQSVFAAKQPLIHCGFRQELVDTYQKIFDLVQEESPGYQQICSGLVLKLLGYVVAFKKQQNFSGKLIEKTIQQIRLYIHDNVEEELDLAQVAEQHQIGYSYFRKMFKKYTGVSPHQYQLGLKVLRARELLLTTDKSIKEIGYILGFSSIYYFSRFFKDKMGLNPSDLRNGSRGQANGGIGEQ